MACCTPPPLHRHAPLSLLIAGCHLFSRSYQAKERPLPRLSFFAQVFATVKARATERAENGFADAPVKIVPTGLRSPVDDARYHELLSTLDSTPYPDPPFIPPFQASRVHLQSVSAGNEPTACLAFDTKGGRHPYEKPMLHDCTRAIQRKDERAVLLWHDSYKAESGKGIPAQPTGIGYLRPSFTRSSNVFCVGLSAQTAPELRFAECNPAHDHQRWLPISAGAVGFRLRNQGAEAKSKPACLAAPKNNNNFIYAVMPFPREAELVPCNGGTATVWHFLPAEYIGDEATMIV